MNESEIAEVTEYASTGIKLVDKLGEESDLYGLRQVIMNARMLIDYARTIIEAETD